MWTLWWLCRKVWQMGFIETQNLVKACKRFLLSLYSHELTEPCSLCQSLIQHCKVYVTSHRKRIKNIAHIWNLMSWNFIVHIPFGCLNLPRKFPWALLTAFSSFHSPQIITLPHPLQGQSKGLRCTCSGLSQQWLLILVPISYTSYFFLLL